MILYCIIYMNDRTMDSVLVFLKKVDKVNKTCMLILIVFSKDNTVMFSRIWVRIWKREKILQLKILLRSFWLKCKSVKKRQKWFVCIETNCDSIQKKRFPTMVHVSNQKKNVKNNGLKPLFTYPQTIRKLPV